MKLARSVAPVLYNRTSPCSFVFISPVWLTLLWTLSLVAWLWWELERTHFFFPSLIHLKDKPKLCLPCLQTAQCSDFVYRLVSLGSWPPAACVVTLFSSSYKFPCLLVTVAVNLMRNLLKSKLVTHLGSFSSPYRNLMWCTYQFFLRDSNC